MHNDVSREQQLSCVRRLVVAYITRVHSWRNEKTAHPRRRWKIKTAGQLHQLRSMENLEKGRSRCFGDGRGEKWQDVEISGSQNGRVSFSSSCDLAKAAEIARNARWWCGKWWHLLCLSATKYISHYRKTRYEMYFASRRPVFASLPRRRLSRWDSEMNVDRVVFLVIVVFLVMMATSSTTTTTTLMARPVCLNILYKTT